MAEPMSRYLLKSSACTQRTCSAGFFKGKQNTIDLATDSPMFSAARRVTSNRNQLDSRSQLALDLCRSPATLPYLCLRYKRHHPSCCCSQIAGLKKRFLAVEGHMMTPSTTARSEGEHASCQPSCRRLPGARNAAVAAADTAAVGGVFVDMGCLMLLSRHLYAVRESFDALLLGGAELTLDGDFLLRIPNFPSTPLAICRRRP